MGDKTTQTNTTDSIIICLKEGPKSINEIAEKARINWRTAESHLKRLEKLNKVIKRDTKHSKIYSIRDDNNYFHLYVKEQDRKFISTVYALIKKFCKDRFNKKPTKTHVYKILWKLKKEKEKNIPIGWYLFGPCAIQIYQGDEKEEIQLDNETKLFIKEATEEYCKYDNITLQKKIYEDEDNDLYKLKEEILEAKEGQEILLVDLIKSVPDEAVDITTDFARITLVLKWEKTKPLFDKLWKYIALIILKNTLKDYYQDDVELYLKDRIDSTLKDIQLSLDDIMRTFMDAKYSQDELYQKWVQKKK